MWHGAHETVALSARVVVGTLSNAREGIVREGPDRELGGVLVEDIQ